MDNTDIKKKIVLIHRSKNYATGEEVVRTKPKPLRKRKIVVARGNSSMSLRGGHTVGDVLTAKALPFNCVMRKLLMRKGYHVSGLSFKYVLVKFFNEFSGQKKVDESEFINKVAFKIRPDEEVTSDVDDARNRTSYAEITALTNSVIDTFRKAKDKYQFCISAGVEPELQLRDEELTMAIATFGIENDLLKKSKSDNYVSTGELRKVIWWFVIIGAIIWLLN